MLSFDYSLSICFSRPFLYSDGPSFSPYKPSQNINFERLVTCRVFSRIVHILARNQREKF